MATTRYPNGITTAAKNSPFGEFILPDTTSTHIYTEDFDYYLGGIAWTFETIGLPTNALTTGDGGRLLLTNSAGGTDLIFLFKQGASFRFEPGKKLWFDCVFQISDATLSAFAFGFEPVNVTPLNPNDGVFFFSLIGNPDIRLVIEKNSVATSTLMLSDLEDATDIRLSFFYNGKDKILSYVNGVFVKSSPTTNLPDDIDLNITFGVQNGEAVAKTMTVDSIFAAKER